MKIALINPGVSDIRGSYYQGGRFLKRIIGHPQITLPYLAALVPPDIDVVIIDEAYYEETVDYDMDVDLVGITILTTTALRGYSIAREFRKRGVTVVLGGPHSTALPNEAIKYADAVVLGEGEDIWQELICDYQMGQMKRFYRRESYHDLKNLPIPRWDLQGGYKYLDATMVQVSRGCPFHCDFCASSVIFGEQYRFRPVDDVLREIEYFDTTYLYFVEDNIVGNIEYSKELFKRLIPYKKQWHAFASTNVASDKELLNLLERSGCKALAVGFESLSEDCLKEIGKYQNVVEQYKRIIKSLHDHGIVIYVNFIFGFDNDGRDVFERTVDFALDNKIDVAVFSILTPYPRTVLYEKLRQEKRLFKEDWWLENYYSNKILYKPKSMSVEELWDGFIFAVKETHKLNSIIERMSDLQNTSLLQRFGAFCLNLALKEVYNESIRITEHSDT